MICVLIVHEDRLLSTALGAVLEEKPEIKVIGWTTTFATTRMYLEQHACDIVLVDTHKTTNLALQLARFIDYKQYATKVVCIGMATAPDVVLDCLEDGVAGFIDETEPLESFGAIVQSLHRNEFPLSPALVPHLFSRISELKRQADAKNRMSPSNPLWMLTLQERKIFDLLVLGYTNKKIAEALVIEVGTTKNHINKIFRKLNIKNREEAVYFANLGDNQAQD